MNTQKDIAKAAGVSLKTVSRVMNDDESVKPATREKVKKLMSEMGYQPNVAAQLMRSKSSNIIGFIANGVATSYSSIDLIRGAQDMAWELGQRMMLMSTNGSAKDEALAEAELSQFRADAVIYATVSHQAVALDPPTRRRILLNCYGSERNELAVVPDDYEMARAVTREILERGYKRPVFLNLSEDHVAAGLRRKGFVDEGKEKGLDLSDRVKVALVRKGDGHEPQVEEVLSDAMLSIDRPDLILCGQDQMAMQVYGSLARSGLAVGQDIGVASFDNQMPIANNLSPGLSTVALPYYEMGRLAMKLACQNTENSDGIIRLFGKLEERSSF